MSQTNTLVSALKQLVKQKNLTYADLAKKLKVSEATIKRSFALKSFSLNRLEQICTVVGIEIVDLADYVRDTQGINALSEEQERALIKDPKLLLVTFLLMSHWSLNEIVAHYTVTEIEGVRLLARLDKFGIIDLLPGNKVRMRLARNFNWRKNGPIQSYFETNVQDQFFRSSFNRGLEKRLVINGMLSDGSNKVLQQRMRRLIAEFESLLEEDRKLDISLRKGTTLVLAIRPWELDIFGQFRRSES